MATIHHFHIANNTPSLPVSLQVSPGRLYIGEIANVAGGRKWGREGVKQDMAL